ncbi:FAD-dependent oxidoreductase, partial [Gluconobacter kondonii]
MNASFSADVVVIGSGICGSLAAQKLAKAGASVLILEAG